MKTPGCLAGSYYDRLPDQMVVSLAQAGDASATEHLLYKYRSLVRTKIRSYFLMGAEKDDLLQVGMIGLWQSVMDYSAEKDISFLSFARICIERHVITAIKTATRQKQAPLNSAISLDYCMEEADSDFNLEEVLISGVELDPEEMMLRREDARKLRNSLKRLLSTFEWEVLKLYHLGKSYREIAVDLECNAKSVDNALGRIKRKVAISPEMILH
ncbi:MAG: RNA polymerase sporulation sigma factor SigH [Armatimonadetes bacterium]|nr:RNA polymerase sporulation sigma factor SigH [Armatimonadota bacterium]